MNKHLSLAEEDSKYLESRRRIIQAWRWAGSFTLFGLLGFIIWLWYSNELLINPFAAIAEIESGSMPDTSLVVMAAMLPVIFVMTLFMILLLLVIVTVSLSNEKRYLAIIEQLNINAVDKS